MPRLFGQGPEGATFEHLAHKVGGPFLYPSKGRFSVFLFRSNLNLVQLPKKVHNVQFVAVLPTAWQVNYCESTLHLVICFWGFAVNCGVFNVAEYLNEKPTLMLLCGQPQQSPCLTLEWRYVDRGATFIFFDFWWTFSVPTGKRWTSSPQWLKPTWIWGFTQHRIYRR